MASNRNRSNVLLFRASGSDGLLWNYDALTCLRHTRKDGKHEVTPGHRSKRCMGCTSPTYTHADRESVSIPVGEQRSFIHMTYVYSIWITATHVRSMLRTVPRASSRQRQHITAFYPLSHQRVSLFCMYPCVWYGHVILGVLVLLVLPVLVVLPYVCILHVSICYLF